jgi:hypothetical protein
MSQFEKLSLDYNFSFFDYKRTNEIYDSNIFFNYIQNSINPILSNFPNNNYSSISIDPKKSIELNTQNNNNSSKLIEVIPFFFDPSDDFNSSVPLEMDPSLVHPSESISSSVPLEIIKTIEVNNPKKKSNNNNNDSPLNKKRIRTRNKNPENNKIKKKKHDKFAKDNIKRKIQVHYIKFLRDLLNHIIKEVLKENIEFKPLDYQFIMKIDKNSFLSIKSKSLGTIFKENPSPKFKDYEQKNIEIYNEIINKSEILKNILDKLYLEFINIYYKNTRKINLRKYGLDKDIILPNNIKFYEDLIKMNETDSSSDNEFYINKIEKIIKKEFVSEIFICK